MADEYILKSYDGGAQTTTLAVAFTLGSSSLVVANGSTFPDGSSGPFVIVVDRGLASEEKFLIDTTSGTNGITFNIQQAGYDGTSASSHSVGASVEHCLDAYTIEQANRYVNLQTARGDLVSHNNTTTTKLAVGSNNTVLMADSSQTTGLKYSTIGSASLADNAVIEAKISSGAVTADKIASSAVTTTKIQDGAVTAAKLDANALVGAVPIGSVTAYAASSAPSGWLICNGQAVSRTTYAGLFAVIGTTYGNGNGTSTFNVPNLNGRVIVGLDPSDADFNALNDQFGSKTHTLTVGELPSHSHGPGTDTLNRTVTGFAHYQLLPPGQTGSDAYALNNSGGFLARSATSTGNTGSGQSHNNVQPSLVLYYIIKA